MPSSRDAAGRWWSRPRRTLTEGLDPARPVDGLGGRLLHVQRHQHRVHLAVPAAHARARPAVRRPPLDGVVPSLRDVPLAARAVAVGRLPGPLRPVAHRPLPAPSTERASPSSSGRRRPGRCRRTSRRPCTPRRSTGCRENGEWVMVARYPDETFARIAPGAELVGLRYDGPFDTLPPGAGVEHRVIPWDEVSVEEGTGIVHIAPGLRRRGLRAVPRPRPADPHARRRVGPLLRRLRVAARPLDRRCGRPDRRRSRRARAARPRRALRASLPALLALRHTPHLPDLRRLVPRSRGAPPAPPRRERDGRVDARVHGQAHGRLAQEHGRLEHLAAPLLRPAAAVLSLLVRPPERDRLEAPSWPSARLGRSTGSRSCAARGSTRSRIRCEACGEEVERIAEVGRRLARRGHRPVLDARVRRAPSTSRRGTRPARRRG